MKNTLRSLFILARRIYKENKRRNIAILVAIVVASMFTMVIFSVSDSMQNVVKIQNLKAMGTVAEGIYRNITMEQYETISKGQLGSEVSYNTIIGTVDADVREKIIIQVMYGEPKAAEWCFNELVQGKWAEKEDEIVVDKLFLSCYEEKYDIGDTLLLRLETEERTVEKEFTISGICSSNEIQGVSNLYISKSFLFNESFAMFSEKSGNSGSVNAYCRFDYSENSEEILYNYWKQYYPNEEIEVWINSAYSRKSMSISTYIAVGLMIGIIGLCAYLTIYTVYYISVNRDVRFYGQLKTIGMRNKQVGFLMYIQAIFQYVIAVPIGLLSGWLLTYIILPIVSSTAIDSQMNIYDMKTEYFVYSALIVLFIMYMSMRKPVEMIQRIPPIHAIAYSGTGNIKKKERKSTKMTLGRFALRNVQRHKFRNLLISTSVCMVLVLFVCIANLLSSVSLEGYMTSRQLPADFVIGTKDFVMYRLESASEDKGHPIDSTIDSNVLNDIRNICPNAQIEPYYYLYYPHLNNVDTDVRFGELYENGNVNEKFRYIEGYKEYAMNPVPNKYWCCEQRYYVNFESLEKCKLLEGTLDRELFETGNYVVMIACPDISAGGVLYHAGEKIVLSEWYDGVSNRMTDEGKVEWIGEEKREYEVMAVVDEVPLMCTNIEETLTMFMSANHLPNGTEPPELYAVAIETDNIDDTELIVDNYVNSKDGEIDYISYKVIKNELESGANIIRLLGGGLALVVAILAVVNFLNHCITIVTERREEFATLRSMGMTKKQLIRMLRMENVFIVGGASFVGLVIGTIISETYLKMYCEENYWLSYNPNLIWGIVMMLLIVFIATRYPSKKAVM